MRLLGAALCLALSLLSSPALAAPEGQAAPADKATAREAYKEGQQLFVAKHYADALFSFKRGQAAYDDPIFLFNIAQCHRLLGNKQEAVKNYRAFLQRVPEPPNLGEIQGWLAKLDAQIEREKREEVSRPPVQGDEPPPVPVRRDDDTPTEQVPTYKKWWPWTILAVGVVGIGLGVGLGLGLRKASSFNQTLADFGPGAMKTSSAVLQVRF